MKHLFALMLALGVIGLVACKSEEKAYEVQDSSAVTLALTGMT